MVKGNNVVPNQHFKKKWHQGTIGTRGALSVKTWFNQPARKLRRRTGASPPRSGGPRERARSRAAARISPPAGAAARPPGALARPPRL
jgi:hypothetical protein